MRTIRTKIYKFSELSKSAKQTAIQWWKDGETFDYLYEEAFDSLKKFCEVFNIDMDSYDFNEPYRSKYSFDSEDTILELAALRLRTYLINNYYSTLFERKPYGKYEKRENGKWRYDRYSKCQYQETSCPFTGVCYDEDLLYPIRQFILKPTKYDFKDLLEDCMSSLCKSIEGEIKARMEDEAVIETIEANEYEFTKDGNRF